MRSKQGIALHWLHRLRHWFRSFPATPGVGLHHLSLRPGRLGISAQRPCPDRTPPAKLSSTSWAPKGWTGAVYCGARAPRLPAQLALAPGVQLSLHRAPTSKFPKAGGLEA